MNYIEKLPKEYIEELKLIAKYVPSAIDNDFDTINTVLNNVKFYTVPNNTTNVKIDDFTMNGLINEMMLNCKFLHEVYSLPTPTELYNDITIYPDSNIREIFSKIINILENVTKGEHYIPLHVWYIIVHYAFLYTAGVDILATTASFNFGVEYIKQYVTDEEPYTIFMVTQYINNNIQR